MSRRKLHWKKVLGSPAAPRNEASKIFHTFDKGAGGSFDKVLLNVPRSNVRGLKSTDIGTRPMGARKLDLIAQWLK
jgi:hypothetical protein